MSKELSNVKNITTTISGNIVDVLNSKIYPGTLQIAEGKIIDIVKDTKCYNTFILPGFVDSHIHIESSMLTPSEFARLAVIHGTIATVSDPHEIGNVLGVSGVNYMIENGRAVPFKFYFGAPSCVPATSFETAGAEINLTQIEELFKKNEIKFLSEMMNFPGVLNDNHQVLEKILLAKKYKKKIDGHAPGLRESDLEKYAASGISTDHECLDKEEALEKLKLGMKIQIREGSAAKNFDTLVPLIEKYYENIMFCSDDKHPDDLVRGHINELVKRALQLGIDKMKVLRCACVNPVLHYNLEVGLLQKGDFADFVEIDNFENLNILRTYIDGKVISENGKALFPHSETKMVNNFSAQSKQVSDFYVKESPGKIRVIGIIEGQLITDRLFETPKISNGYVIADPKRDILKIAVINRYQDVSPSLGFVRNFGLKKGAVASSVAHDSHNIIAVGVTDEDICRAVNLIISNKGGIVVVSEEIEEILSLPIAGIITNADGFEVAKQYSKLDKIAKDLGSKLKTPFMTLSFLALLVIPKIKLSDKGLFDGEKFEIINLFEEG
ncbi:MAG: adenine deaminase [Candidatus Edwardsbacteria bacterium]